MNITNWLRTADKAETYNRGDDMIRAWIQAIKDGKVSPKVLGAALANDKWKIGIANVDSL